MRKRQYICIYSVKLCSGQEPTALCWDDGLPGSSTVSLWSNRLLCRKASPSLSSPSFPIYRIQKHAFLWLSMLSNFCGKNTVLMPDGKNTPKHTCSTPNQWININYWTESDPGKYKNNSMEIKGVVNSCFFTLLHPRHACPLSTGSWLLIG